MLVALSLMLVFRAGVAAGENTAPLPAVPGGVEVGAEHMILSLDGGHVQVLHMLNFRNSTGGVVSEAPVTLPAGFAGLEVEAKGARGEAAAVEQYADGFKVAQLGAGETSVVATYSFPWREEGVKLPRQAQYPTDILFFLFRQNQLAPNNPAAGFQEDGPVEMGDYVFGQYSRRGIVPGDDLTVTLVRGAEIPMASGQPADGSGQAAAPGRGLTLLNQGFHGGAANVRLWQRVTGVPGHGGLAGAIILVAMVVVLAYLAWELWRGYRRRRVAIPAVGGTLAAGMSAPRAAGASGLKHEERQRLEQLKEALIKEVAGLDLEFRAGRLGEAAHRNLRGEAKRKLMEVTLALRDSESGGESGG